MANASVLTPTNYQDNVTTITASPLNNVESAINNHAGLIDKKCIKPSYTTSTLAANNWVNNTYSFEDPYPSGSVNIEVQIAPTATVAEFEAFSAAKITGSVNSNVLTAIGGAPVVNIPIILTVFDYRDQA